MSDTLILVLMSSAPESPNDVGCTELPTTSFLLSFGSKLQRQAFVAAVREVPCLADFPREPWKVGDVQMVMLEGNHDQAVDAVRALAPAYA